MQELALADTRLPTGELADSRQGKHRMLVGLPFVDTDANDTVAVDNERRTRVDRPILLEDTIQLTGFVLGPVAQQRELQLQVLGKVIRCCEGVDADAQNLDTGRDEIVLDLREAVKFGGSATRERERIKGKHYGLPSGEAV